MCATFTQNELFCVKLLFCYRCIACFSACLHGCLVVWACMSESERVNLLRMGKCVQDYYDCTSQIIYPLRMLINSYSNPSYLSRFVQSY